MKDRIEMLRGIHSFRHLRPADLEALAESMEERVLEPGTAFIREGDHDEDVFFIMEGDVEITRESHEAGGVEVRKLAGRGDILGLLSLITREPRSATCSARGRVRLAVMPLYASSLVLHGNAPIACAFQHALALQLVRDARGLNKMLAEAASD